MRRLVAFLALALASCSSAPPAGSAVPETAKKYSVFFSPKGGCTQAVVDMIGSASSEVLIQAYSFTSKPIAAALVAKSGKTTVNVIADSSDVGTPGLALLTGATGMVPTWIDSKHAIAHNKVIIVDEKVVETGSFNYTLQAETSNAENCLIIHDAVLAKTYADNWRAHQAHSVPVQEPTQ